MAVKNKPMKSNLFRFVTLRNPQLIEDKDKEKGFIYHPNLSKSAYAKIISLVPKEKKLALKEVIFKALKTRNEVKKIDANLYAFSSWLMKNKNAFSYLSIKDNIKGATVLTKANELLIWDNLIYQTLNRKSVYVREALVQILIANKFLSAFFKMTVDFTPTSKLTEVQKKELLRRAKAAVVISKDLLVSESPATNKFKKISAKEEQLLIQNAEIHIAKERISSYQALLDEMKALETPFSIEEQKRYVVANEKYNASVEKLIDTAAPVIVDKTDPKTGIITKVKTYPDLKLPKFSFIENSIAAHFQAKGKLTNASLELFKDLNLGELDDFSKMTSVIKEKMKTEYKLVFSKNNVTKKLVKVGGATVNVAKEILMLKPYCFIGSMHKLANSKKAAIYMYLGTGYANASITSASYTLTNTSANTQNTGTQVQKLNSNATTVKHLFFPQGIAIPSGNYTFSGEFTLDNGVVLTFNVVNIAVSRKGFFFNSCCTIKTGGNTDPVEPVTISNAPLYGVTKLGIADFRRVEQEVCCYVPGEVSHIENILAREYKERSTRSLTSHEVTTEKTSEREIENLTDTTTTERNEMQSEISSVINEDKSTNYGANASVNGTFPSGSYSVDAFANFSSSSATSNSNTQAQTYAQEVTERAMERIVQKVSSKRTSRVLREFEENNKHGFDNTKGDKHISGVYRWVDKIYKNTLFNYGKRLMYEFAMPEPAKFFKKAIIEKIDDGTASEVTTILPELPEHPKNHGIYSAADISETNYQSIAAYYNGEVEAIPERYNYVGKSFTKSQIGGDGDRLDNKAVSDIIKVPKGYKAISAKTTGKHNGGAVQVSVNGRNLWINSNSFVTIENALEEVPVSAYFNLNWITNVNIVIKCERTNNTYEQWQNKVYKVIMDAYYDRVNEYNDAILAQGVNTKEEQSKISFNPLFNRSIEKRELKRLAIDLLATPKGHNYAKNNYETGSFTNVTKNKELQTHIDTVKFFEQAFDWDIMSYMFYPYFYAAEENWIDLFQETDAADPIFQTFLQSGMARTVVPVRPGFEDAVNWYMTTGEIWNGQGIVTDQDDDLYVSIAEEMQTIEGEVEGTWETKLPTSLTVLQAGTIGLALEGLPCDTQCDDWALFDSDNNPILDIDGNPKTDNPLKQTNQLIGGTKGVGDTTTTTTV